MFALVRIPIGNSHKPFRRHAQVASMFAPAGFHDGELVSDTGCATNSFDVGAAHSGSEPLMFVLLFTFRKMDANDETTAPILLAPGGSPRFHE